MAFESGTQFGIRDPGQAGARQDDDVQARQFILVLPETLPHLTLYAIAGNSTSQVLLGNSQAQPGMGQSIGSTQYEDQAIAGPYRLFKDPFELPGLEQALAPAKRTRGGSRRTRLVLSGTAQGLPLRRSVEPDLWHDAR